MSNDEYLEAQRAALEQSVGFFAADNKGGREIWVVRTFLQNMNIGFSESEIVLTNDDPPDVFFRDARFEIKEIMDPNRRRHDEYKEALEKARSATSPSELITEYTPKDITLQELYNLVVATSTEYARKYSKDFCRTLDCLYYVNLMEVTALIEQQFKDRKSLQSHPWRSVSFVMGYRAGVLAASPGATAFIKNAVGTIALRERV